MRPPSKKVDYRVGDKVEVCAKQEGFFGSYFEATIISHLENGRYVVQYKNLVEENEPKPLTETLFPKEIRPAPPHVHASQFKLHQFVDVFDLDGWWVGQVTGRRGSEYFVYFSSTNEELQYPFSKIRVHHEWSNGEWLLSN